MRWAHVRLLTGCAMLASTSLTAAQVRPTGEIQVSRPTQEWARATPAEVGLDERPLVQFDADVKAGKLPFLDSIEVFRCGKEVFERKYSHDYATIYGQEARTLGPLNTHLTGPYNYFDPAWHPYYRGSELHTLQSVTKTVSSVIIGTAITRGDFKSSLDTPLLNYFDAGKVQNLDERKRRITLRHVLTMTTGLAWTEKPSTDPRNDTSRMEATQDWAQYVLNQPMVAEPGAAFNYSSGVSALLAEIFHKETGKDIAAYAEEHLFKPLGISYYWKRTPSGVTDTEGGLYLEAAGLAKIGELYLRGGMRNEQNLVSPEWVHDSLTPFTNAIEGLRYGFQWWLLPRGPKRELVPMAIGFGGQLLMILPEEGLIVVATGWDILGGSSLDRGRQLVDRISGSVRTPSCGAEH